MRKPEDATMFTLSGIAISEGIATGKTLVISHSDEDNLDHLETASMDADAEIARFLKRSEEFAERLQRICSPSQVKDRDIFDAAAGFISNQHNVEEVIDNINKGNSAVMAARMVLQQNLAKFFSGREDPESESDNRELRNIVREFIYTLSRSEQLTVDLPVLEKECIIVAKDLTPAQFLSLRVDLISALILESGSPSGHLATVIKELNIPSVFGVSGVTAAIKNGSSLIVDANNGVVIVDPPEATTEIISEKIDLNSEVFDDSLLNITIACSVGTDRKIGSNRIIREHGLGLLRSEFLFLSSDHEPAEDEMTRVFRDIFCNIDKDAPIAARTFDFAGDKKPLYPVQVDEDTPLKGYGACVGTRLLKREIRALLKACPDHRISIVLPLVTRLSESKYLNMLIEQCQKELIEEGCRISPYETALMIETPAAVLSATAFANQCSRFIIGTSSLADYAAAPRESDVAFTPALAKMIVMAAKAAHDAGVPVGIAGRYASRIELVPFFYRMGATYITVASYQIYKLRSAVERLNIEDIKPEFDRALYDKVMQSFTGKELNAIINNLNLREEIE